MGVGISFVRSTCVRRVMFVAFGVTAVLTLVPGTAQAQSDPSHWGVSFSASPGWSLMDQLKNLIEDDATQVDIEGTEFAIGIARGSNRGGDWAVNFVSKPFKDGSGGVSVSEDLCFQNKCYPSTESTSTTGVKLTGVEFDWFARLVNLNRVQIGLVLGGGIASFSGTVTETTDDFVITNFNPQTGAVVATPRHTVETHDASEEFVSKFPLGKVEAAASVILAPGLKARISGGMNFPGMGVRVGAVYLFGVR